MNKKTIVFGICFLLILSIFQNCSNGASFTSDKEARSLSAFDQNPDQNSNTGDNSQNPPPNNINICNPLNPSEVCPIGPNGNNPNNPSSNAGLKGKLYYLTPEAHNAIFNNDLQNAHIIDYRNHGFVVPVYILMTSINITPRSWSSGFILPNGEQVTKENEEKLFEWFHLDMSGFIELPQGNYQFATLSDDGMRVTLNNNVILNNDSIHAPSYECSQSNISFNVQEKKYIRVEYFQGPRDEIAMQLLVRPSSKSNLPCNGSGEWVSLPSNAYTHNID